MTEHCNTRQRPALSRDFGTAYLSLLARMQRLLAHTRAEPTETARRLTIVGVLGGLGLLVLFGGCSPRVKVEAPDKPIEINVNVKIDQEVRIKLDRTVEQTLANNPELFGLEPEK